MNWTESIISISEIESLLNDDYEIEVDSPDGFVPISQFVDKGLWDEYRLELNDGRFVRVNENHLFETNQGWKYAKDIWHEQTVVGYIPYQYLCDDGWHDGRIIFTGNKIPIVDIQIEHENHRYYTNGISSHNTGVGKSMFMCHCAAGNLIEGLNVLYITLEMAEEKIAERIDANLMNVAIDELSELPKDVYQKKIDKIRSKTVGKLIIKEYPTASAGANNFRYLLNELKLKKNFKPDIIYIDYLNICSSSRLKVGSNVNSYLYVKAIAEELRGLAVEMNLPIVSATQTNRSGFCLDSKTLVITKEGSKKLSDIQVGDLILSNSGWNEVLNVFPKTKKKMFKITTESGKQIIASEDHLFPTESGEKNIKSGLCLEDRLLTFGKNKIILMDLEKED